MNLSDIEAHVRAFFKGHDVTSLKTLERNVGPTDKLCPEFRVLVAEPGPKTNLWVYTSVGAAVLSPEDRPLEFCICTQDTFPGAVELLAMAAYYHHKEKLGLGHTLPIGHPWQQGSLCSNFLVSLPFPFGEEFELCEVQSETVHILWLLPITDAERQFKINEGQEALESRFDEVGLRYWEAFRSSVV